MWSTTFVPCWPSCENTLIQWCAQNILYSGMQRLYPKNPILVCNYHHIADPLATKVLNQQLRRFGGMLVHMWTELNSRGCSKWACLWSVWPKNCQTLVKIKKNGQIMATSKQKWLDYVYENHSNINPIWYWWSGSIFTTFWSLQVSLSENSAFIWPRSSE